MESKPNPFFFGMQEVADLRSCHLPRWWAARVEPPNLLAGKHVKQTQEEQEGLAVWVRENRRAGAKPALLIAQRALCIANCALCNLEPKSCVLN